MIERPRRIRKNEVIRKMVRETRICKDSLIYPIFVVEGTNIKEEILSMPGQYRYSVDKLGEICQEITDCGVNSLLIFGIPDKKDEFGFEAYNNDGIVQKAVRHIKKIYPNLFLITDLCLCEYTSHGHCGIIKNQDVDNDITLDYLAKTAVSHGNAGADMVAPSDMMDGRVGKIREALDDNGFSDIPIMSYSVKYASSFYGPFRSAAESEPKFGDRKTYQMDYHNKKEGIKEVLLDIKEGADIVMVKPAMSYLDLVNEISQIVKVPVATYSVSGEYSMVKAAAAAGFIDEENIICEMAVSAYRAGADIYITYFAKEIARFIDEGRIG